MQSALSLWCILGRSLTCDRIPFYCFLEVKVRKILCKGCLLFPNKDWYEGDFVDEQFEGFGKYNRANEVVYEGNLRRGQEDGQGKETWADGTVYEGTFVKGKKNGKGKYTWKDESTYEGDFVDNMMEGYGVYK